LSCIKRGEKKAQHKYGLGPRCLGDSVTPGIAAGLFIGKQIGVFGSVFT
jgi:Na+/H+ antiporter NhaA